MWNMTTHIAATARRPSTPGKRLLLTCLELSSMRRWGPCAAGCDWVEWSRLAVINDRSCDSRSTKPVPRRIADATPVDATRCRVGPSETRRGGLRILRDEKG